ncbi:MAG: alkaline phosphatase D family protein, partial [Candidatus Nanopelagicales bacterium]
VADSTSKWTFMAQHTVVSDINGSVGLGLPAEGLYNYDSWDGYWSARDRLITAIKEGQVRNPVVLTGDFHCNLAFDLIDAWPDPRDFPSMFDQIAATKDWEATKVGTEIATGAISSPTFFEPGGPIPRPDIVGPATLEGTSWARYGELLNNGYVLHDITQDTDEALFRVCQANYKASTAEGKPKSHSTVVIADGVPGVSDVR